MAATKIPDRQLSLFETEYSVSTNPATPTVGLKLYPKLIAGQRLPSIITPLESYILQPHFGFQNITVVECGYGTTSFTTFGQQSPNITGTVSLASLSVTNFRTQSKRVNIASPATAGSAASVRSNVAVFWRGNAAGFGGFAIHKKFSIAAIVTGNTFFCGVLNDTAAQPGNVPTSAILNMFGIGLDTADTNFQFMRNDGTGTATKVDTGIAIDTTTTYAVRIFCPSNGAGIYITFADLQPGGAVYEAYVTTDIPSNTTLLTWQIMLGNNATASAVTLGFSKVVYATPN